MGSHPRTAMSWQQDSGGKVLVRRLLQRCHPISCTSGEETVEPSAQSPSPSQTAQAAEATTGACPLPGLPGSPSLLHYGRMLQPRSGLGRTLELPYREATRAVHQHE